MHIKESKSVTEATSQERLFELYQKNPVADKETLANLYLFLKQQDLKRVLVMNELYKMILDVPGDILEFGVRWGGDLVLFQNFRGTYEPFNHTRKIVGFDTFSGFPSVSAIDNAQVGNYSVSDNYELFLEELLTVHESLSPISHIKKFQLYKGDVLHTLPSYLEENSNRCLSLVYFDLDLYEPTKFCLEKIQSHLTKGSVVAFDDFGSKGFKGESLAIKEIFSGFNSVRFKAHPLFPRLAYMVVE